MIGSSNVAAKSVIAGHPARFVGANAALMHGENTRSASAGTLDSLQSERLRVARIWALGETDRSEAWRRFVAFRVGPSEWVESSFEHLDRVLVDARARDVRVIVVLANRWSDHGGLPQYARWADIEPRYNNLMASELRAVLASGRVQEEYFAHLDRVVGRVNSITGGAYAEDPTIFAYELFNEVSAPTCAAQEALESFLDAAAARVRTHDGNHLIAAGHIGYNSSQSREFWRRIHARDWVGYADTHGYPQNLLAADSPGRLADWLSDRARAARELGTPLVVGEVGVPREWPDRHLWFDAFLTRAHAEGVDGVLPWIFRSWDPSRDDAHGLWSDGPRAQESQRTRDVFRRASKEFALEPAAPAGVTPFPLGIETIAPFVHGEWGDGTMRTDPWALAEGCVSDDEGWVQYALDWQAPAGTLVEVSLPATNDASALDVRIDGHLMGRWHSDAPFEPAPGAVLPLAGAEVAWLRLEAFDAAGARTLAQFTRELPASGELSLSIR